jgi:hypothetical protein
MDLAEAAIHRQLTVNRDSTQNPQNECMKGPPLAESRDTPAQEEFWANEASRARLERESRDYRVERKTMMLSERMLSSMLKSTGQSWVSFFKFVAMNCPQMDPSISLRGY